jgi:hypothetical protein
LINRANFTVKNERLPKTLAAGRIAAFHPFSRTTMPSSTVERSSKSVDASEFREAMREVASGVTIVTSGSGERARA